MLLLCFFAKLKLLLRTLKKNFMLSNSNLKKLVYYQVLRFEVEHVQD